MNATVHPEHALLRQAEQLVGLEYVPGSFDCGHLAVLAQQRLFARQVQLPLPGERPQTPRAQATALARCREALCTQLDDGVRPLSGDVALFVEEAEGGGIQWHIGTVLAPPGQLWVLHIVDGGHSLLQRLEDCCRMGLWLEGFYRWRAQPCG
jgi:hypothetical protein